MRRFVFELDPVLRQRVREEEARQREVAAMERERVALEARMRAWAGELDSMREAMRDELRGGSGGRGVGAPGVGGMGDIAGIRMQASASVRAMAESRRVAVELAGVLRRLEAARERLGAASAARRAVELLRERRLGEWRRQARLEEQRELDELAGRKEAFG